jgi:peptidoglycan/xylan/chitin deacetylase (PgdA/CDA1 family)
MRKNVSISKDEYLNICGKFDMAGNSISSIKYSYVSQKYTSNAISHAFKYLSAITAITFVGDLKSPDIFNSDSGPIPPSAKLIMGRGEDTARATFIKDAQSQTWKPSLSYDPISEIIDKISLVSKLGPYAEPNPHVLFISERTLSRLITEFIDQLQSIGLVPINRKVIRIWPDTSRCALSITHDIDIPKRSVAGSFRLLFVRHLPGGLRGLFDSIISEFGGHNPYDNVPEWTNLEMRYNAKSTFFVFAGQRNNINDPKYKVSDLTFRLGQLKENDFEIALHTSIESHSGLNVDNAKKTLEAGAGISVLGLRPHYLSAFYPEYWKAASEAGFAYSSSLGFDDRLGYYCGLDLPFIPFDKKEDRAIDIVEIPIAIMDCGLIGRGKANSVDIYHNGTNLIDAESKTGGLIVMDWHQRTFYNRDYPGWVSLLIELIDYAKNRGAQIMTMADINYRLRRNFGSVC